jgi:hypothetical protein
MSEQNLVDAPDQFGGDGFEVEEFDGGNEGGGPVAPGMGQSKSSRRRRRKRKNKLMAVAPGAEGAAPAATEDAAVPPATIVMEGESLALAAGAASSNAGQAPRRPQQGGQQQFGQGQGGKRWKKKFRDRERRVRNDNPGNESRADNAGNYGGGGGGYSNGNGGYGGGNGYRQGLPDNFGNLVGGFKRKNKGGQQRERGFVGPMDHSYRAGDANYADSPPSTIQMHGHRRHRHQGDNQPLDFSGPRPVPIPEDAQTHIYLFIEDLFLTAKINEASRKLGVKVAFVKNEKEALAELTSGDDENKPSLIVFDLNNANAKPLTTIPKIKTKLKRSVSIIGFLSHLQGDLKAKAVEAGCDVVMPRAAFSQNLPNLLRRYGVDSEEEINFNY